MSCHNHKLNSTHESGYESGVVDICNEGDYEEYKAAVELY